MNYFLSMTSLGRGLGRAVVLLLLFASVAQSQVTSAPKGFTALFNGKDLSGWRGGDTFDHRQWLALVTSAATKKMGFLRYALSGLENSPPHFAGVVPVVHVEWRPSHTAGNIAVLALLNSASINGIMTRTILCTLPLRKPLVDRIRKHVQPYQVRHHVSRSGTDVDRGLDESVEILFTNSAPTQLEQAPHLRWVQLNSAGINHVMGSPIYLRDDLVLTTGRGAYDVAVAEFALGLMLSLSRNFPAAVDLQRAKKWCPNNDRLKLFANHELRGKTVGILGYGGIGQEIARLCCAFGMRPSALRRGRKETTELRYRLPELRHLRASVLEKAFSPSGLISLLKQSDFVVITLPLTPETEGLIDEAELARMKKTTYLVNVSRGPVVNEKALIRALGRKQIAGAALDVFEQEPLTSTSALYRLDNVIITPHVSGAFDGMFERATAVFLENFDRYRNGLELFNVVDRKRGY